MTKLNPEINKNVRIKKNVYSDLPKGTIATLNEIQRDFYARGSHRYWVSYGDNNYYFNQKEIEAV
jgi:hypothetical protein